MSNGNDNDNEANRRAKLLRAILKTLNLPLGTKVEEFKVKPDGSIERLPDSSDKNANKLIHAAVDLELLKAFQQWYTTQDVTVDKVLATTAYFIAHEIYYETQDENEGCSVVCDYANYIHDTLHVLYAHYGAPKKVD